MSNKTNPSVLVNDTSSYYLKQYAALQFPGSVDNSEPKHPFIFCSNKKNLSTAHPYVKLAIRTMTSMVRSSCSRARLMTR